MFTGIITDVGNVLDSKTDGKSLAIRFKKPISWNNLELGESVNTDGVCLTVASQNLTSYVCQLMPETLKKTNFGVEIPTKVNLERALRIGDRLGGHFVQGHTDDIGQVVRVDKAKSREIYIQFLPKYLGLVVYKGSIVINGVALTITEVKGSVLGVSLVPYTLEHTTLGSLNVGSNVNLEFDLIGKYIAANLKGKDNAGS